MGTWRRRRGLGTAVAVCAAGCGIPAAVAQDCLWTARPTSAPGVMREFRGVFDGARSLLAGSLSGSPVQLWAWDQTGWTLLSTNGPPNRTGHAVAYDTARGRLVLHAGKFGNANYRDTWEWDGTAWNLAANNVGPNGRGRHAMAYDAARGRCVMFGGDGLATDTWEWDGTQWFNVLSVGGPSGRALPGMVYDSDRQRTVLFGGLGISQALSDTWEWDGAGWVERVHAGPAQTSTAGVRMIFDPVRHRTVMLGGGVPNFGSVYASETWEYDGAAGSWSLRSGGGTAEWTHGPFVFDTVNSLGLLFETATTYWEWRGAAQSGPPWFTQQPPQSQLVSFGGSIQISAAAMGTGPLSYQWFHASTPLTNGGNISGADTPMLSVNPVGLGDFGLYSVVATNSCGSALSAATTVRVLSLCYPNCDSSTIPPFLNVLDFACFLNRAAAGCPSTECYVNCDGSTTPPVLNVLDFGCFINAYAGGCTVP